VVQVIDESMSTARLRERRQVRQQRREAALRLQQMRPEARAAARTDEERIGRRIAVMEQARSPAACLCAHCATRTLVATPRQPCRPLLLTLAWRLVSQVQARQHAV
jgi:hypothetical protein